MIGNLTKTQTGVFVFHHAFPNACKISEYTILNNSIEELEEMYEKEKYCYVEAIDISTEKTKCAQIVALSNWQDHNEYCGLDRNYQPSFNSPEYQKAKEQELQNKHKKNAFWLGVVVTLFVLFVTSFFK